MSLSVGAGPRARPFVWRVTTGGCPYKYRASMTYFDSTGLSITTHSFCTSNSVQFCPLTVTDRIGWASKRPMIYSGGGVVLSGAAAQLTELVRLLGFPCTNTLMGLGGYPATDKQFLGMPGMHGTYEACMAMQYCDVLIAIGARFDDRVVAT